MASYMIKRLNGITENVIAEGIAFETHHILFMDHNDNPIFALHADEVREIIFD